MRISNMSVSARLGGGFGAVVLILLVVSTIGLFKLSTVDDTISNTVDYGGTETNLLSQCLSDAQDASAAMRNLIILNDEPRMKIEQNIYDKKIGHYLDTAKRLQNLFDSDPGFTTKEKEFLEAASSTRQTAMPLVDKAAKLGLTNDPAGPEFLMTEAGPALDKWTSILKDFVAYEVEAGKKDAEDAHAVYRSGRNLVISLTVIGLLTAIGLAVTIARSIQRQLGGELKWIPDLRH